MDFWFEYSKLEGRILVLIRICQQYPDIGMEILSRSRWNTNWSRIFEGAVIENHLNNEFYISSIPDPNASSRNTNVTIIPEILSIMDTRWFIYQNLQYLPVVKKNQLIWHIISIQRILQILLLLQIYFQKYRSLMHLNNIYANIPVRV